ncbi:hypothetical protein TWF694_003401 [Orbilia ellipsospora]|uniref:Uncharacterized protein n=1 Tax=Orbilia ellipsospora TaxID=2528407 RepID=A0AAV9WXX5_9PEZI
MPQDPLKRVLWHGETVLPDDDKRVIQWNESHDFQVLEDDNLDLRGDSSIPNVEVISLPITAVHHVNSYCISYEIPLKRPTLSAFLNFFLPLPFACRVSRHTSAYPCAIWAKLSLSSNFICGQGMAILF